MKKIEFLAASLPYDLKVKEIDLDLVFSLNIKLLELISLLGFNGQYLPIIRHLESLTKECVQSDYNEGNPFVPIVELNKLFDYKDVEIVYYINNGLGWRIGGCFANTAVITDMMLIPICQMLKWHFWPNMPEGEEVVYVTDSFNPYK